MRTVYQAFPADDAFIVVKALIDDPNRENVFGPLISLNTTTASRAGRLIKATQPQSAW